jgi:hypothetical protein
MSLEADDKAQDTWAQKYEREDKEREAQARKAWETYKKRKPTSKEKWGGCTEYVFDEGTTETAKAVLVKTTRFRFVKDGKKTKLYMSKLVSKSQLFLVVSGPLKGKRIKDNNQDYVLFNRNSGWRGASKGDVPKCVLVHRSAFET